ncbi:hypothetical protein PITC_094510 [Penicillium italicum]|uniref:Uncharacterized protein n=1 Tax=Penicillium italicum TaxID=40296 RepID=A0A0A2KID7_PENIT|nr:hypothetical protein PITC_094510 [Penicillium italicum]
MVGSHLERIYISSRTQNVGKGSISRRTHRRLYN